jgi:hypothetical protein
MDKVNHNYRDDAPMIPLLQEPIRDGMQTKKHNSKRPFLSSSSWRSNYALAQEGNGICQKIINRALDNYRTRCVLEQLIAWRRQQENGAANMVIRTLGHHHSQRVLVQKDWRETSTTRPGSGRYLAYPG